MMPVFPESPSPSYKLPSFHPVDSLSDTRDLRSRWPTSDVQKRSRSNSTPPDSRFVHNQNLQKPTGSLPVPHSPTRAQNLKPSWTPGHVGGTVQAQGRGLIEVGGLSATHSMGEVGLQGRRSNDAHLRRLLPGRISNSLSVDSPLIPGVTTNPPPVLIRPRKDSNRRSKILFYHKNEPYYGFTNFSAHPVVYEGRQYPTSEHLFQSFKFAHRPSLAEHIRTCSSRPSVAFSEARRFAHEVQSNWSHENIKAMNVAILYKFTQHRDLRRELLSTGDAELIENSGKDSFWGCGADGKGRNELGKALERLRTHLREEERR